MCYNKINMSTFNTTNIALFLGIIAIILFVFRKFMPSKFDIFFAKANQRERDNGLTFDPSLSFFRLHQHYREKIENKKVFKFSLKEMERFKNTATKLLSEHILKVSLNSGIGVSQSLVKELLKARKICEEYPELEDILKRLSKNSDLIQALRNELNHYEQCLDESSLKENSEKSKEIYKNKLAFFFVNLRSEDVLGTRLFEIFEEDKERLGFVLTPTKIISSSVQNSA